MFQCSQFTVQIVFHVPPHTSLFTLDPHPPPPDSYLILHSISPVIPPSFTPPSTPSPPPPILHPSLTAHTRRSLLNREAFRCTGKGGSGDSGSAERIRHGAGRKRETVAMRGKRMIGTLTVGSGVMRRGQRFGFWLFPRLSSSGLVSLPLALSLLFSLLFYFNFFFNFFSHFSLFHPRSFPPCV